MLGFYLGFLVTIVIVDSLTREPSRPSALARIALASVFGLVMAFDGMNSSLDDWFAVSVYPPANIARLVTGAMGGVSVALVLFELSALAKSQDLNLATRNVSPAWTKMVSLTVLGAPALCLNTLIAYYAVTIAGLIGAIVLFAMMFALVAGMVRRPPEVPASWLGVVSQQPSWFFAATVLAVGLAAVRVVVT